MKQTLLHYTKIAIIAALLGLSIGVITATFQISFEFGLMGFAVYIAYRILEAIAQHIADKI